MKNISNFQNKKVLVLGLAKTGFYAAKLLQKLGAIVVVNDASPLEDNSNAQELISLGIRVISGYHPLSLLEEDFCCMVKNPGIPYSNPMVQEAQKKALPIYTDVELAYLVSDAEIIGITGTNGKTTTTNMINRLLNQDRPNGLARVAGNIGVPSCQVAMEANSEDDIVMELSSFQLMGTETFKPRIAVIVNIFEAHLDYHTDRQEYVDAKWKIQANMTKEDYLVINWNSQELQELSKKSQATVIPFSAEQELENGAYVKDGSFYFKGESVMALTDLKVPGHHNIENALAAIAVAKLKGWSNQAIIAGFASFYGVEHRLQFVAEVDDRQFYNDSKATNILATTTALEAFNNRQVVLLAGGLDRGNEFDDLIPALKQVHHLVLFGQAKEKIAKAANQAGITYSYSDNAGTAVAEAFAHSQDQDIILLSPACASWDQYDNFELRGQDFVDAVMKLKDERA